MDNLIILLIFRVILIQTLVICNIILVILINLIILLANLRLSNIHARIVKLS